MTFILNCKDAGDPYVHIQCKVKQKKNSENAETWNRGSWLYRRYME